MKLKKPETRFLHELKNVIYDRKWLKSAKDQELYYMHRGVKTENDIRYDITVIPKGMLGEEFIKTKGHYHIGNYGELYKVLAGEVIFLIQKKDLKDAYYVKTKKGEYISIPPGYGHVAINPSYKTLRLANWVSKDCKSDYESIEKKKGFCYYYTISGWLKNKSYKKIPTLKTRRPLKKMPGNLKFLYDKP